MCLDLGETCDVFNGELETTLPRSILCFFLNPDRHKKLPQIPTEALGFGKQHKYQITAKVLELSLKTWLPILGTMFILPLDARS